MNAGIADIALQVFAVAPQALGGVRLRGPAGPPRDAWLAALHSLLPATMPWRRLPLHAGDDALLGGLDLAATLAAGRPVAQAGLLAQACGGVLVAAMAERLSPSVAARLSAALDGDSAPAVVALDEGLDDDEVPPAALIERLAMQLVPAAMPCIVDAGAVASAREAWRTVAVADELLEALVAAALALGVHSARAPWHALVVARIAAALDGRHAASADDVALAARLVLAPRATRLPPADEAPPDEAPEPPSNRESGQGQDDQPADAEQPLEDQLVAAACAWIPPGLLALLASGRGPKRADTGRMGQHTLSRQRGRPIGAARGEPRGGARLALIDTLRAAAPWQSVRRTQQSGTRVIVQRDDLRIQRRVHKRATTTIFAIDASGSQALHRLAEAKGAVELLLADCYARRDRVAVIGFRGASACLLLAPTRSLVRARRQLAGLPGGGGTPLASGIDAAQALATSVRRGGATPLVVLLTDGRANVSRSGAPGRTEASADALAAARALRATCTSALLIDTSPQPGPAAQALAEAMGARCIALPHAAAKTLSQAVRIERDHV